MKGFLIILLAFTVTMLAVLAYMGAFERIEISEKDQGPFTFVYRDMSAGGMSKVREMTTALDLLLESRGVTHRRPLDVFFPDQRGEIGFAVEGALPAQLTLLAAEAKVREIPVQRCMVAEFPWRNPLSFVVGYFKVDPALAKHRNAHGYKKVEALALNNGDVIVYMQPIARE